MWIPGVQPSPLVVGANACAGKDTLCSAKQQVLATAITLVTVPPEGGIYYGQVYLVWSSEDD
jgi:hypothetical protein